MSDDSLEILLKYNNLVKTLAGQAVLIKDKTMLPFLAYCLSSTDASIEVIGVAVETLFLLGLHDCNIARLKDTFGVAEALGYTCKRVDLPVCSKMKALELYKKLDCKEAPAFCTRSQLKARELRGSIKVITLFVHGLSEESRHPLESTIIKVNGVVSVVLDVNHQRCTLRTYESLTPHVIAAAIFEGTGMEVKLISRNSIGQEVFRPLLETTSIESDEDMPSYLAEVDSPVKKEAVSRLFLIKDKSSHWLHSAVGFFQKSFYW